MRAAIFVLVASLGFRAFAAVETGSMVTIPGGIFPWGDKAGDGEENEWNGGTLSLGTFTIDTFPVTNGEYAEYVKANPATASLGRFSSHPELGKTEHPVVGVSFDEAEVFCAARGKRLPTEFEWEKAARGSQPFKYPWGNESPESGVFANFFPAAGIDKDGFKFTAPVGTFPKNVSRYGMRDAVGNVWQWTATWFEYHVNKKQSPSAPPKAPDSGTYRTIRGGGWSNSAWVIRATTRHPLPPGSREPAVGFRCAKDGERRG